MPLKPEFFTQLNAVKIGTYQGRGLWKLFAPLVYSSAIAGQTISVPSGFVTDYASVPRIPGIWWVAGGCADEAAVVHDWIYNQQIVSRDLADKVFLEAMEASGVSAWRRYLMYAAVRAFGMWHYGKGKVIVDVGSD
jgi:hypothetical protein